MSNGLKGLRPLVAEKADGDSFVTYSVRYEGKKTKDGSVDFQAIIYSWSVDYDQSIQIADKVSEALEASTNFYSYESAEPIFNEQGEIYTKQIFNIKT